MALLDAFGTLSCALGMLSTLLTRRLPLWSRPQPTDTGTADVHGDADHDVRAPATTEHDGMEERLHHADGTRNSDCIAPATQNVLQCS